MTERRRDEVARELEEHRPNDGAALQTRLEVQSERKVAALAESACRNLREQIWKMPIAPEICFAGRLRHARPLRWILGPRTERVVIPKALDFVLCSCAFRHLPIERVEGAELLPSQA